MTLYPNMKENFEENNFEKNTNSKQFYLEIRQENKNVERKSCRKHSILLNKETANNYQLLIDMIIIIRYHINKVKILC